MSVAVYLHAMFHVYNMQACIQTTSIPNFTHLAATVHQLLQLQNLMRPPWY